MPSTTPAILVTGGTGYIGSHACVELLAAGYAIHVLDNLCNSRRSVQGRIERIAGKAITLHEGDIRDRAFLKDLFAVRRFDAVVHFAGLKAVGESVEKPELYFDNNVRGSGMLLAAMQEAGVRRMVFSSSATVYGETNKPPFTEDAATGPVNPYGQNKLAVEQMLADHARRHEDWRVALLRYFNPVGAHESGLIGEDPNGIPNNLMPYVSLVAAGRLKELSVFGNDFETADGTGVRDYVHVADLAAGHVAALNALDSLPPVRIFNLGTGRGYSVLDVVKEFERASGRAVPYRIAPRRPGDVAVSYADAARAARELDWRAGRGLATMCRDAWRWQQWRAAQPAEL
jgi:UDP-glucose 4-epimerase